MSTQDTAVSFEAYLDAVGHVERRRLLLALLNSTSDGDPTVALDRLDSTAADETLRLSLHHVHLPKLEDLGFVDADRDQRSVTTGPQFDEIRPILKLLDDNRDQLPHGWV
ncbi:DUF7344 domain-containing protein [Halobaculum halobium]|uniref:DUF7344 domain-containing protein n=1 Tax=Halobaculum halobium TaxID=3032281 RepID=UPI003D810F0B